MRTVDAERDYRTVFIGLVVEAVGQSQSPAALLETGRNAVMRQVFLWGAEATARE